MRKNKTTEEFEREVYEKVGNEYTVLGEYINAHTKIKMRHNCDKCNNYEWDVRPNDFFSGRSRCHICMKEQLSLKNSKTQQEFIDEVYQLVGQEYTILGEYQGTNTKIRMRHNCDKCDCFEWDITPHSFLSGTRCKICRKEQATAKVVKSQEQFIKEIYSSVGEEYSVLGEYINNKTPIKMRHNSCGYEWNVRPYAFLHGSRCYKCFGTPKKNTEQFKQEVSDLAGDDYSVLGEYQGANTKIKMKHNTCGHVYKVTPNCFFKKSKCPWCNQSSKEKEITKYLENKNIHFSIEYRIEELIDKKPLKFDFAIFDKNDNLKLLLEYHGTQHFYDKWNNKKEFNGVQKRDQLKIDYCYENNIPLLMIPYTEDKNIEEILQETLINLGLLSEK